MYEIGTILAGVIGVVTLTIAVLKAKDAKVDFDDIGLRVLAGLIILIVYIALSWMSIVATVVVGITYYIYNKITKSKETK
jgi:hypothetical protein